MNRAPVVRDVVLVGGGHSHALLVRRWAMQPLPHWIPVRPRIFQLLVRVSIPLRSSQCTRFMRVGLRSVIACHDQHNTSHWSWVLWVPVLVVLR